MADFSPLHQILEMDFSQLRALDGRATDESIIFFVDKLKEFFTQFGNSPVSLEDKQQYRTIMSEIINGINIVERKYYSEKQNSNKIKPASPIKLETYDVTLAKLPDRLQYLAAGEKFGETVRNSANHVEVVKYLQQWSSDGEKPARAFGKRLFFSQAPVRSTKRLDMDKEDIDGIENEASSSEAASSSKEPRIK